MWFDDGNEYVGIIIGQDPETKQWITRFEDGTEDETDNTMTDKGYTPLSLVPIDSVNSTYISEQSLDIAIQQLSVY